MPPTQVPARTAALTMDFQTGIVSAYVKDDALMERVGGLLRHLRGLGTLIVHVAVGFRPGLPEVSARNMMLGAIKSSPRHQQLFQGASGAIHPAGAPVGDDIVITKHRVSASSW